MKNVDAKSTVGKLLRSFVAVSVASALLAAADVAAAAGASAPSAGPESTGQYPLAQQKKSRAKRKSRGGHSSSLEGFVAGYKAAYALIYDKADFAAGISALRALDRDDDADVANLIGYASRKLGRYDDARFWYERALAIDPKHAVTWSYYGMWQAEQGNLLKAKDDLEKVRLICGATCEPYRMLKDVIDGTVTY
jgi:tetratricopeptide (TPR) repeat protein